MKTCQKKRFFAVLSAFMVILSGNFLLTACAGGKPLVEKNIDTPFALDARIREALYYASLAPNGHNTQVWKVGVHTKDASGESGSGQTRLRIYLDSQRLLPAVDPAGRESLISIGAFLENLSRALTAYGLSYTLTLQTAAVSGGIHNNPLVAEIVVSGVKSSSDYSAADGAADDRTDDASNVDKAALALMEKRHTDKRKFLEKPLDSSALTRIFGSLGGNASCYLRGTADYDFIQSQTLAANEQQAADPDARNELADWLRFSDTEAKEKADGLPAEQLGLSGIVKTFYYMFSNREKAKGDGFAKQSVKMAKNQLLHCEAFFTVNADNNTAGYLNAGMIMERLWLAAAAEGISIHPMSQALEEDELRSAIAKHFSGVKPVQMIMRAGYVKDYGKNNLIRRPLADFVFAE